MNDHIPLGFEYEFEFLNADGELVWREKVKNLMPQDAIDYVAKAIFGDQAPITTFYVGLFAANVIPTSNLKASDIPSTLQEFVGYSQATRPIWSRSYDGVGSVTNEASRAEFSITTDARLYGGLLVSSSTKGGDSGLLMSVARFSSPRDVTAGGTFRVSSGISFIPTNVT